MRDEHAGDAKLIAVSHEKNQLYNDVNESTDLPPLLIEQIKKFFESYKAFEKDKWVKVEGWDNVAVACEEVIKPAADFKK